MENYAALKLAFISPQFFFGLKQIKATSITLRVESNYFYRLRLQINTAK